MLPSLLGNHSYCFLQPACVTETGPVCGELADCTVRNHEPVCSCPPGYDGNPLERCVNPSLRFAGRT